MNRSYRPLVFTLIEELVLFIFSLIYLTIVGLCLLGYRAGVFVKTRVVKWVSCKKES